MVDAAVRSSCVFSIRDISVAKKEKKKSTEVGRAIKTRTHIEIVVDDHHRRIAASALTLDLNHGELAILRRFSRLNSAKVAARRFQDFGRAAEHAWRCSAYLHKVLANWVTRKKTSKYPPHSHVRTMMQQEFK